MEPRLRRGGPPAVRSSAPPMNGFMGQTRAGRLVVVLAVALAASCATAAAIANPLVGVGSWTYADRGKAQKLRSVGARWAYDWSPRSRLAGSKVEFVPMAWGAASVTDANVASWTAGRRARKASWLLGFNEPDNSGQANMSPDAAIA